MKYILKSGHISNPGLMREENQDSFYEYIDKNIGVFCVADGMGGHSDGKRASGAVAEGVKQWTESFYPEKYQSDFHMMLNDFEKKLTEINHFVFSLYNRGQICGSTCVVLIVFDSYYAVFSLGDSRLYRKRGFLFTQLTKDDVWQHMDDVSERLSPEEQRKHRDYDKLVRAIGIHQSVIPNRITDSLKKNDVFLLCSDGVYKYSEASMLKKLCSAAACRRGASIDESLRSLENGILSAGAPDNLTAILVYAGK